MYGSVESCITAREYALCDSPFYLFGFCRKYDKDKGEGLK
jgi:hypothetical protein